VSAASEFPCWFFPPAVRVCLRKASFSFFPRLSFSTPAHQRTPSQTRSFCLNFLFTAADPTCVVFVFTVESLGPVLLFPSSPLARSRFLALLRPSFSYAVSSWSRSSALVDSFSVFVPVSCISSLPSLSTCLFFMHAQSSCSRWIHALAAVGFGSCARDQFCRPDFGLSAARFHAGLAGGPIPSLKPSSGRAQRHHRFLPASCFFCPSIQFFSSYAVIWVF
jgi:hypothetical protein